MDSITELFELLDRQDVANEKIDSKSKWWAKCDTEYRVALAQCELQYKAQKYPAVLIHDLSRGHKTVAELKEKAQIAEGDYWTAVREYEALQTRIRVLDRQVSREWGNER